MSFVTQEASGIFKGTVQRNFMETVIETHRNYLDVWIPALYKTEDLEYPMTYVPAYGMIYPLLEGDEVWVYFNQNNPRFPVFWRPVAEYASSLYDSFELPDPGDLVTPPETEDTVGIIKLSETSYLLSCEGYTVLRYENNAFLLGSDGNLIMGSKFSVLCDEVEIEAIGATGKVKMQAYGIEMRGNSRSFVTFAELKAALDLWSSTGPLGIYLSTHAHAFTGGPGTVGLPSPTTVAAPDISLAEATKIRTGPN